MLEAAWVPVEGHAYWKGVVRTPSSPRWQAKGHRGDRAQDAGGGVARSDPKVADREAVPEQVASKFLEWSWKLGRVNRAGLTSGAFIRRELRRLQLGENVPAIS